MPREYTDKHTNRMILSTPTLTIQDPETGRWWRIERSGREYRIPGILRPLNGHPEWGDFIEFYDLGTDTKPNDQYVGNYYSSTLLDCAYGGPDRGLNLYAGVPEWQVSREVMDFARAMARYAMTKAPK